MKSMTKTTNKTLIKTLVIIGFVVSGAIALGIAVFNSIQKQPTIPDVTTDIVFITNDMTIPNRVIDYYEPGLNAYNQTIRLDDIKFTIRSGKNLGLVKTKVNLEYIDLVLDHDDINMNIDNSSKSNQLLLDVSAPQIALSTEASIQVKHDASGIILLNIDNVGVEVEGLDIKTKVNVVNDKEVSIDSIALSDVDINKFKIDWDDIEGWSNLIDSVQDLADEIGFDIQICKATNSDTEIHKQIEECIKDEVEKELKNNSEIEKEMKKPINKAVEPAINDPFSTTIDNSGVALFSNTSNELESFNTTSSSMTTMINNSLVPSYTISECGADVNLLPSASLLPSITTIANGSIDVALDYDYISAIISHVLRAGIYCPEKIPIEDSGIGIDLDLEPSLSGDISINKDSYETFVTTINYEGDSKTGQVSSEIESITTEWEENDGLAITTSFTGTLSGKVGVASVNQSTQGSITIIVDITTAVDGSLLMDIKKIVANDIKLPKNLLKTVNKNDVIDTINDSLDQKYYSKKIIENDYFYCPFDSERKTSTAITMISCDECDHELGFAVSDIYKDYDINLYSNNNHKLYFEDYMILGLDTYLADGSSDSCEDLEVWLSNLPNSEIQDMIDNGYLHEQVINIQKWMAIQTIDEIENQVKNINKNLTTTSSGIPINQSPWYNF